MGELKKVSSGVAFPTIELYIWGWQRYVTWLRNRGRVETTCAKLFNLAKKKKKKGAVTSHSSGLLKHGLHLTSFFSLSTMPAYNILQLQYEDWFIGWQFPGLACLLNFTLNSKANRWIKLSNLCLDWHWLM